VACAAVHVYEFFPIKKEALLIFVFHSSIIAGSPGGQIIAAGGIAGAVG
jgi:hypothetical protein